MKVICIVADTFRRDHLGAYGNDWIHTPNLDKFASESAVFDNAYIGSFPTVPNRRDVLLGRGDIGLPFNRWKAFFNRLFYSTGMASSSVIRSLITSNPPCQKAAWVISKPASAQISSGDAEPPASSTLR